MKKRILKQISIPLILAVLVTGARIFCAPAPLQAAEQTVIELGELLVPSMAGTMTSSNPDVVAMTSEGLHARKAGTSVITISNETSNTTISVKVRKRGMVYPEFSMMKGEKLKLDFSSKTASYSSAGNSFKSSDPKVATVNAKGKIKARHKGTAVITAAVSGKTYQCMLTVTKKIKSVIYLTFDDGPSRYSTPKILDILKKNNVKATFFELKPAKADFDLTKRVLSEGHTLALHGYQHSYSAIYRSESIYRQNLDKLRNLFFKKFGIWSTVSRFPGGSSNTVSRFNPGIMSRLSKKVGTWGYKYFDWNVSSNDAGGAKNSGQVYRSVVGGLQKNRANVVLMHDFTNNDKTIGALSQIISYGKKNGYTFLPLSPSTAEVHHGINN